MSDPSTTDAGMTNLNGAASPSSGASHHVLPRPPQRSSARGPLIFGLLAILAIAGGLVAGTLPRIRRDRELKAAAHEVSTALPRVSIAFAKAANTTTERVLPGNCQPLLEAAIYARTTGYLKRRLVDIGDHVKEGQLLAEIAAPEIDAQLEQVRATLVLTEANLVRDQASEMLANADFSRSKNLLARQAVPQQEYDAYLATAKVAGANVKATESTLRVNRANILRLETLQSFQKLTAPFSGVITARHVDPGDLVSADSPNGNHELFHLVQMDTLRVFVSVPQVFSTDVKVGQKAIIYRREDPTHTFTGTITRTADALDPGTRTLLTEVQVDNGEGALKPGMYLQVKFLFERQVPAVLIPAAALSIRADGPRLAVLDKENRARYRKIQLGRDYGLETEVVSGLSAGETVVIHPGDDLPEGTKLDPVMPKDK